MPMLSLRGNPIGNIQGVLFDKDGTLSNSEKHLTQLAKMRIKYASDLFEKNIRGSNAVSLKKLKDLLASSYGLSSKGLKPSGTIAVASQKDNLISTATIFCIFGEDWPKAIEMAEEVFLKAEDFLQKKLANNNQIMNLLPGSKSLLNKLNNANVICALISNDSDIGIQKFLNAHNLEKVFSNIWSADSHPAKPDPNAIQSLCKILKLSPSECALIGDADSDLVMAQKAGVGIILGYTAGWTHSPYLTKHHELIHHWDELSIQ